MGYYYDGKFTVGYTEEILVSLELDKTNVINEIATSPWVGAGIDFDNYDNSIHAIIEELCWETESKEEEDGVFIYKGFIDGARYNFSLDIAMKWLSRHGVLLDVRCDGEDGESWIWKQQIGEISAEKEILTSITVSQHGALKSLLADLTNIADTLELIGQKTKAEQLINYYEKLKNV